MIKARVKRDCDVEFSLSCHTEETLPAADGLTKTQRTPISWPCKLSRHSLHHCFKKLLPSHAPLDESMDRVSSCYRG